MEDVESIRILREDVKHTTSRTFIRLKGSDQIRASEDINTWKDISVNRKYLLRIDNYIIYHQHQK